MQQKQDLVLRNKTRQRIMQGGVACTETVYLYPNVAGLLYVSQLWSWISQYHHLTEEAHKGMKNK